MKPLGNCANLPTTPGRAIKLVPTSFWRPSWNLKILMTKPITEPTFSWNFCVTVKLRLLDWILEIAILATDFFSLLQNWAGPTTSTRPDQPLLATAPSWYQSTFRRLSISVGRSRSCGDQTKTVLYKVRWFSTVRSMSAHYRFIHHAEEMYCSHSGAIAITHTFVIGAGFHMPITAWFVLNKYDFYQRLNTFPRVQYCR